MSTNLFRSFKQHYGNKYNFSTDIPIGEGAHAQVFAAHDQDRDVDVAIKIFHDGEVPIGTHRGWKLTSGIVHKQVAQTFTVESFIAGDGKEYKAVVSRLIPGKSLKSIFDWWDRLLPSDQSLVAEDFSKTFLPSLIDALTVCHTHNFGHGDLHPGNIMVFLTDIGEIWEFNAVLIDFDAESVRTAYYMPNEQSKIDCDVRSFNGRLGPYITTGWKWGSHIATMYSSYQKMADIQWVYGRLLNFIEYAEKNLFTEDFFQEQIKQLTPRALGGVAIQPILLMYRSIVDSTGHRALFEDAYTAVRKAIHNDIFFSEEVSIVTVNERKHELYRQLFP